MRFPLTRTWQSVRSVLSVIVAVSLLQPITIEPHPAEAADASAYRTWNDSTGTHQTEAKLLDFDDGKVTLKKKDGSLVTLSLDKLSDADREYVRQQTGAKPVEKPAPAETPKAPAKRGPRWATFTNFRSGQSYRGKIIDREEDGRRLYVEAEDGRKSWLWAAQWRIRYEKDSSTESTDSDTSSLPSPGGKPRNVAELNLGGRSTGATPIETAKDVVVTGVGTDPEKALQNAFSQAIEQTVGVLVDSETKVKNDELIRDEVLTYSRGYVEKYDIVKRWEEGGLQHAEIHAVVGRDKLVAKLKSIKIAVKELPGDLAARQFKFDATNEEQAAEVFKKAMADFDMAKLVKAEIVGEPEIIREGVNARIAIDVRLSPDVERWKAFITHLRPILGAIASRRAAVTLVHMERSLIYSETRLWSPEKQTDVFFAESYRRQIEHQLAGSGPLVGLFSNVNSAGKFSQWELFRLPESCEVPMKAASAAPNCRLVYLFQDEQGREILRSDKSIAAMDCTPALRDAISIYIDDKPWLIGPVWRHYHGGGDACVPVLLVKHEIMILQDDLKRVAKTAVILESDTEAKEHLRSGHSARTERNPFQ